MNKNSTLSGAFFLSLASLVFMISGYLINITLGRFLGPQDYGIYGVIITIMTVVNIIQTNGLPQAISKYVAENENQKDSVLRSGLILQVISVIVTTFLFFVFAPFIAKSINDPGLTHYIQTSVFIIPIYGILALYLGYYNGLRFFKKQALMSIVYSLSKIIFVGLLALSLHLYGVIYAFILSPLIALFFGLILPRKNVNFPFKKLILFSLPLVGFGLLSNLQYSVDLFFIKALLIDSNREVGLYAASQNISRIPYFGLFALSQVIFPSISQSVGQKLLLKTQNTINESLKFALILLLPATLLLSATAKQLLELLYSKEYIDAASSLSVLTYGLGFLILFTILGSILGGAGKPWITMVISFVGLLITSLLCLILIPSFGLVGAAYATTFGGFVAMFLIGIIVYWKFKALIEPIVLVKILFASSLIFIITKLVILPVWFLPIYYFIIMVAYFIILFLLNVITSKDYDKISPFLPLRLFKFFYEKK